jgi:hypothetical protein
LGADTVFRPENLLSVNVSPWELRVLDPVTNIAKDYSYDEHGGLDVVGLWYWQSEGENVGRMHSITLSETLSMWAAITGNVKRADALY